jgi:pantoate--beta-alanine ligase
MIIIKSISKMQEWSKEIRQNKQTIAVVPTMGFLHEGHLSLIRIAKEEADKVVVTNFVNPTQFGENEDLNDYPRDFDNDCKLCQELSVDVVFAPSVEDMYPKNSSTWVTETVLSQGLCAKSRPIHFRGVTTIVTKLFNATLPDIAVFGQKDAQQVVVIKRMVRDLNIPVKIVVGDIVREVDGLAMSSRNKYLSPEEREKAVVLSHSLLQAKHDILAGEHNLDIIKRNISGLIQQYSGVVDYIECRDYETFATVTKYSPEQKILIAIAVYYGKTRLLDNIII